VYIRTYVSANRPHVIRTYICKTLGVVGVEGEANTDPHKLKGKQRRHSSAKFRRVVTKRHIVRKLKFSLVNFSRKMGRMDTRSIKRESTFEHCANISRRSARANLSYMPAKFFFLSLAYAAMAQPLHHGIRCCVEGSETTSNVYTGQLSTMCDMVCVAPQMHSGQASRRPPLGSIGAFAIHPHTGQASGHSTQP